jgi:hypothetical protein
MNWTESLDIVVSRTGHERYRELCADANPDVGQRDAYRALMIRQATDEPEPSPEDRALRAYVSGHPCGGCH